MPKLLVNGALGCFFEAKKNTSGALSLHFRVGMVERVHMCLGNNMLPTSHCKLGTP